MATTINSISDTVAIQQVAWRRPRATDFRVVQGAHNLLALTNLFAAAVGALPNMIGGSNSARIILTGVAARRIGVYGGLILIAVAVLPKAIALAVAIPRPVLVAYMVFMLALLFVQGMSIVVRDGIDGRKSAIVGLSLWLGVGFQNQLIFPELLTGNSRDSPEQRHDDRLGLRHSAHSPYGVDFVQGQASQCESEHVRR